MLDLDKILEPLKEELEAAIQRQLEAYVQDLIVGIKAENKPLEQPRQKRKYTRKIKQANDLAGMEDEPAPLKEVKLDRDELQESVKKKQKQESEDSVSRILSTREAPKMPVEIKSSTYSGKTYKQQVEDFQGRMANRGIKIPSIEKKEEALV